MQINRQATEETCVVLCLGLALLCAGMAHPMQLWGAGRESGWQWIQSVSATLLALPCTAQPLSPWAP